MTKLTEKQLEELSFMLSMLGECYGGLPKLYQLEGEGKYYIQSGEQEHLKLYPFRYEDTPIQAMLSYAEDRECLAETVGMLEHPDIFKIN